MRSDAAGVDLGSGEAGEKERQDEGSPEDAMADGTGNGDVASGRRKNWVGGDGHGDTSL